MLSTSRLWRQWSLQIHNTIQIKCMVTSLINCSELLWYSALTIFAPLSSNMNFLPKICFSFCYWLILQQLECFVKFHIASQQVSQWSGWSICMHMHNCQGSSYVYESLVFISLLTVQIWSTVFCGFGTWCREEIMGLRETRQIQLERGWV